MNLIQFGLVILFVSFDLAFYFTVKKCQAKVATEQTK